MEYLLNGEIYIKKGPICLNEKKLEDKDNIRFIDKIIDMVNAQTGFEIIIPDYIEEGSLDEINYVISEIKDLEDYSKKLLTNNTIQFINKFINYVMLGGNPNQTINQNGNTIICDYSGCQNFWQLFIVNSKIIMQEKVDETEKTTYKVYKDKFTMDKNFIRLSEFLDSSSFIGREFKRTKPLKLSNNKEDKSFISPKTYRYIVLYSNGEEFLVKEVCDYMEKYFVLESKYINDGNYTFFGDVYEEYRDKNKIYREIVSQVLSLKKGQEEDKKINL